MHQSRDKLETDRPANEQLPIWRQALNSVFGAAWRLHQYRDARDMLFRHAIHEQERRMRQRACCDEQW
jgi:hypothetical protein